MKISHTRFEFEAMTVQSFFILLGKHPLVSERAWSATQIVRGFSVQNVPDENHHLHKHSKTHENKEKDPALRHRKSPPPLPLPSFQLGPDNRTLAWQVLPRQSSARLAAVLRPEADYRSLRSDVGFVPR